MEAEICLGRYLQEQFDVMNGLRQGFCMAPVIFNLFTYLMMEHWQARVEGAKSVGISLKFKYDHKLFKRYIKNSYVKLLTECLFADDGALLASKRSGAEKSCEKIPLKLH